MAQNVSDIFLQLASRNRWNIVLKSTDDRLLPHGICERYPHLPEDYLAFLRKVAKCTNAEDNAWFLCESDYHDQTDSEFHWNEFELQSLEAADDDAVYANQIRIFWDTHFPILLSVKSGYAYLAISLSKTDFGTIVYGYEPEYEEAQSVFPSFHALLEALVDLLENRSNIPWLSRFF